MGKKHSKLFQYSTINLPVKCNLKFINFKKYNDIIYLYFTPTKKIISSAIQLEFKQKNKPLENFNILLNKDKANYTIIDTNGYLEYEHNELEDEVFIPKMEQCPTPLSNSQRKILVRTNIDHKIISIVYILPIAHLV